MTLEEFTSLLWHDMNDAPDRTDWYLVTLQGEFGRYTLPAEYVGDDSWEVPFPVPDPIIAWTTLPKAFGGQFSRKAIAEPAEVNTPIRLDIDSVCHEMDSQVLSKSGGPDYDRTSSKVLPDIDGQNLTD